MMRFTGTAIAAGATLEAPASARHPVTMGKAPERRRTAAFRSAIADERSSAVSDRRVGVRDVSADARRENAAMSTAPDPALAADIERAAARLRGEIVETPCLESRTLSAICGCEVFLKFENLQFTASFKERGAFNRMAQLTAAERAGGVLAVSAGNHAQAVAYHAQRMGIAATIVMPRFASSVKVENTRNFGAEVVLRGDTFDDARVFGLELAPRARPHHRPSLRRPRRDRRAGHGRARDAGAAAGARHAGGGDRRRRPDRRHGHRRTGEAGPASASSACRPSASRRPGMPSTASIARAARRRSPTASASSRPAR